MEQIVPALRDTAAVTGSLRALVAAADYERLGEALPEIADVTELAELLCDGHGRAGYLGLDLALVRLIEDVLDRLPSDETLCRGRLQAKLALELRGDPTTIDRRRELLASAAALAENGEDPVALIESLQAHVHALWEPGEAADRIAAADRAVSVARQARLGQLELDARISRVDVLMGLGRLAEAEIELGHFGRLAPVDDDARQAVLAARHSSIELVRGRFDEAERQAEVAATHAFAAGLADADQLVHTLRNSVARERGDPRGSAESVDVFTAYVRRLPGHHMEGGLARALYEVGREEDARVELARALTSLRSRHGPMWLVQVYEAAVAAVGVGGDEDRAWLMESLRESGAAFATVTVLFAGSTFAMAGALAATLARWEEALADLDRGITDLDAMGALPWAARARRTRALVRRALGDEQGAALDDQRAAETFSALGMGDLPLQVADDVGSWQFVREPLGFRLVAGDEWTLLPPSRGLEHLQLLLANPGKDISALLLETGGEQRAAESGIEVLDSEATRAYRSRLRRIDEALDAADRQGDAEAATVLQAEREAIASELRRAVGLGGRARRTSDEAERARVNVTRNLRRAIEKIASVAPRAAVHLGTSVKTGATCRYEPTAGGPASWRTS